MLGYSHPKRPCKFFCISLQNLVHEKAILKPTIKFSLHALLLEKKAFIACDVLFSFVKSGSRTFTGFACLFLLGFTRLAEGDGPCSGRVEVHSGEDWTPVSDGNFTFPTAQVICAERGCGKVVSVLGHVPFRESDGRVWAEEFRCKGEEPELWSCPRVPCPGGTCQHSGAVQVVCSGEM